MWVAILISDKEDFRTRKLQHIKCGIHNDQEVNTPRKHNTPQCVCNQQKSIKIHEARTDRNSRRNR